MKQLQRKNLHPFNYACLLKIYLKIQWIKTRGKLIKKPPLMTGAFYVLLIYLINSFIISQALLTPSETIILIIFGTVSLATSVFAMLLSIRAIIYYLLRLKNESRYT